jgi:hypothetical protein
MKLKLMNDNIWCHFLCSAWAGFVATVVGSPVLKKIQFILFFHSFLQVDVMKTRIMNAKKGTGVQYKNVVDCFIKTLTNEVQIKINIKLKEK